MEIFHKEIVQDRTREFYDKKSIHEKAMVILYKEINQDKKSESTNKNDIHKSGNSLE